MCGKPYKIQDMPKEKTRRVPVKKMKRYLKLLFGFKRKLFISVYSPKMFILFFHFFLLQNTHKKPIKVIAKIVSVSMK